MNQEAHQDGANATNDIQNALTIINQFSAQYENWTSDIIINSIVLTTSLYQTLSREQICGLPATRNSVFKVMKEIRKKYVLVLDPNRYCPSKADWNILYSDIKRLGNENGMNLIVGYGSFNKGAVSITCNRQRRYKKYKNFRGDYDGDEFSSNGFSPMSKAKSLRRSKQSEKKKASTTNNTFYHKNTNKPILGVCCSFQFRIYVDNLHDVYFIKSGTGFNHHQGHPKLKKSEINPSFKESDERLTTLRNQLSSISSPPSITRRALYNESGFLFSRRFLKNNINEQMLEINNGDTTADQLLRYFRGEDNVKFVVLFDDLNRGDLHTTRRNMRTRQLRLHINEYDNQETTSDHEFDHDDNEDEQTSSIEVNSIRERMKCSESGRMLLAIAWTTKEASRFFKLFPEVCSWDVTEGTNNEKRKLFIGLNYDSEGHSNPHTHIFLPSGRRWVFNWIASHAIPILHGNDVCSRVNLNIFDEDPNEIIPFEGCHQVYGNAKVRICWFHRGILKTAPIHRFATGDNRDDTRNAIYAFDTLCDCISDDVENIQEYVLTKNLIHIWLESCLDRGVINDQISTSLTQQLTSIDSQKTRVSNYAFKGIMHLGKRCTTSNEVRHRNLKYGEDRLKPLHSMKNSAQKITKRIELEAKNKEKRIAQEVSSSQVWNNFNLDVNAHSMRIIKGQYDSRSQFSWISPEPRLWYVMKNDSDSSRNNSIKPNFKRVRKVKFQNDSYSCSCKYFEEVGLCCRHIFAIGVPLSMSSFHVRYWKKYSFYHLRDTVPEEITQQFSFLSNINNVQSSEIKLSAPFPHKSSPEINNDDFYSVINRPYPTITNWPQEMIHLAISRCSDKTFVGVGLSQEINVDISDQVNIFVEQNEQTMSNDNMLYHHLMSYVSDICKYTQDNDVPFRRFLDIEMSRIIQKAILRSTNNFNAESFIETYQMNNSTNGHEQTSTQEQNNIVNQNIPNLDNETIQLTSHLPHVDRRLQDTRIRYAHES